MAQPITNLTALWVQNEGIQLSWTAAPDATVKSMYEIYALKNTPIVDFPINYTYVNFSSVKPTTILPAGSGTRILQEPATKAVFPWSSVLSLGSGGNTPLAVTVQVVHVDLNNVESVGVSATAYQQNPITYQDTTVAPHFKNIMVFDPNYGHVICNTQDTNDEITSSVEFLVGSIIGQRSASPNYGIEDLPLSQINTANIEKSIGKWEPRANAKVSIKYDNYNNAILNVNIQNNGRS